jgi:hypothetical protein
VTSTSITGLIPGHLYNYQVTGINRVGEGKMSPTSVNMMAATIPGRCNPPVFLSSTSTSITLKIDALSDNGGSAVTHYKLYADDGTLTGDVFTPIQSYDGSSFVFQVE